MPDPAVVALLRRLLARGRLAHAYLFTGTELDELERAARWLARTINCAEPLERAPGGAALSPCGRCSSCHTIAAQSHPDIQWVRPESKSRVITTDQVRGLMHTIQMKPTAAEYKVGVVVAADRLNAQAANAFLKTLEEPPARSILLLLTTEPQRVLETILSRCLRLNLGGSGERRFDPRQEEWLRSFAESAGAGRAGLFGRYQLVSSVLGQLTAMKGQVEETLTARSQLEQYDDLDPKLREKWEDELSAAIDAEYRRQRAELLAVLQWWLRDVWLLAQGQARESLALTALLPVTEMVARRINGAEATQNLAVLEETQRLLAANVQEALVVEVGLLKLKL